MRASSVGAGRARRGLTLLLTGALIAVAVAVVASLHLTFNLTTSMPLGFYRKLPVDRAPARGDIVLLCPPAALARFGAQRGILPPGDCPEKTASLLKHVAAVAGDVVDVRASGIAVNGIALPDSAPRATDSKGRPLRHVAPGRYVMRSGELWLWSPSAVGWDSRYYGPLAARDVKAFVLPFAVLPQR